MSAQPTINYDALAKQAGAVDSGPAQPHQAQPNQSGAPVDYDALAKKSGAVDVPQDETPDVSGITRNADGSWVITPKEGESFADTMKRAAEAGKHVTPEMIQSQTKKGLKEAPVVLAAAPVMGALGTAALGGAGEAAAASPEVVNAIKAMAKAHPLAAQLVKRALEGAAFAGGGGAVVKHTKWLWDLLP